LSRISTAQTFALTQGHIAKAKEREQVASNKAATQKELLVPSQAPADYVIAASIKDDLAVRESIGKNASLAAHVLNTTESILSQSQDIVQKIHELALQASSTSTADAPRHVLPEVQGLYENLLQALNTKFGERTLLAGHRSNQHAFDKEGNFLGDEGKIEVEIDRGLKVPLNLNAKQVILGEEVTGGVNIIQTIKTLIVGLEARDNEMIRSTLNELMSATDQLSTGRTQLAGRQLSIQQALETHTRTEETSKEVLAKIEEADPIKVFSDLAREQTVLRAAIETGRKVLTEDPTDILFR
jgi:flagellar hook-associated protein 3 FlgL